MVGKTEGCRMCCLVDQEMCYSRSRRCVTVDQEGVLQ